jgi:hypothetical protein
MLQLFVIRWRSESTGKVWESERCSLSAMSALASFRKDASRMRQPVTVLGISDADGKASLQLV